jgi:hypothetical protein
MGTIKSVQFYFAGSNVRVLYNIMSFVLDKIIKVNVYRLTHMAGTGNIRGPDPFRYSTSDHITA